MIETHPFGIFVPKKAKFLLLGSFTGKRGPEDDSGGEGAYDWFYSSKRNQFWQILEEVYGVELKTKADKTNLFSKLGLAVGDIIYQCERVKGNNLDSNLINIVYNIEEVEFTLKKNDIKQIYFSSRFVEDRFKRYFKTAINNYPGILYATLPSPSPRYAAMSKKRKVEEYRKLLPKLR